MLRELNTEEMEMVSGGGCTDVTDDDGNVIGELCLRDTAEFTENRGSGGGGSGGTFTSDGLITQGEIAAIGGLLAGSACAASGFGAFAVGACGLAGAWATSRLDDVARAVQDSQNKHATWPYIMPTI